MPKRFLLADDDALFRKALRHLLASKKEWEICAEAKDGAEAVERAQSVRPDLAILDLAMPGQFGLRAARQIIKLCPETLVMAVSFYDPATVIRSLQEAGVRGFVSKANAAWELISAIETVLRGNTYFNTAPVAEMAAQPSTTRI